MASVVGICNRALQKLGAKSITSLTEDSVNARECAACYEDLRLSELQSHRWNFAIQRDALAADATAPAWGRANSFELPATCLKLLAPYPEDNLNDRDYIIEGRKILTNESAPLYVRFVADVTDPNVMSPIFREALACKMALEMCEKLTQSNTKKGAIAQDYDLEIKRARKANAFEVVPQTSPDPSWITARQ